MIMIVLTILLLIPLAASADDMPLVPGPPPSPEEVARMLEEVDQAYEAMPDCPPYVPVLEPQRIPTPEEAMRSAENREKQVIPLCVDPEIRELRRQLREERRQRKEQGLDIRPSNP